MTEGLRERHPLKLDTLSTMDPIATEIHSPTISRHESLPQTKPSVRKHVGAKGIVANYSFHVDSRHSLLSSSAPSQDFRGLYNLAGLALVAMNFRLVVENLMKYGILLKSPFADYDIHDWYRTWPCLVMLAGLLVFPYIAHQIEVISFRHSWPSSYSNYLQILNVLLVFFLPIFVIRWTHSTLIPGLILEFCSLIITLKLISYAHVCSHLRKSSNTNHPHSTENNQETNSRTTSHATQEHANTSNNHPTTNLNDNNCNGSTADKKANGSSNANDGVNARIDGESITQVVGAGAINHMYYFVMCPTLIYQLSYPRSPAIRPRFVLRRISEVLFCLVMQLFLFEQYVMPTIKNSLIAIHKRDYVSILERTLKLAVPNGAIWLLMFYCFFHAYLNLSAELLRFGDRLFYKDWWNAQTLDVYWRNWNLPVHNWVIRHVYAPALRSGLSSTQGMTIAFLFSAALHEVLVSVPMHTFRLWAFFGMLGQVPLIALTKLVSQTMNKPVWGNVLFWTSFLVFGQPLLILLYAHEYITQSHT